MRVLLQVGDRVRLVAAVARVFDDATLEIGVDVSSAAVGAEAFTPINSGFLTVRNMLRLSGLFDKISDFLSVHTQPHTYKHKHKHKG